MVTRFVKGTGVIDRAGFDPDAWDVPLLLTADVDDADGDRVRPEACVTAASMYANYEHQAAKVGVLLPDVRLVSVPVHDRRVNGLKGVARLNRDGQGAQAKLLVESGVLTGASIEFEAVGAPVDRGFKSLRLDRPAYDFRDRWRMLGVALCALPVCPLAGVIAPDPAEVREKALKVVTDNAVGGVPLLPVFAKSLSALAGPRRAAVTVPALPARKAMDPTQAPPADAVADPAMDAPPDAPSGPPEVDKLRDLGQRAVDIANELRDLAASTIDDGIHKQAMKLADQIEALAAKKTAIADGLEDKLASRKGGGGGTDEPDGDEPVDPADIDAEATDDPEQKAIVAKSLRLKDVDGKPTVHTRKGFPVKRRQYKASDLGAPVPTETPKGEPASPAIVRGVREFVREVGLATRAAKNR